MSRKEGGESHWRMCKVPEVREKAGWNRAIVRGDTDLPALGNQGPGRGEKGGGEKLEGSKFVVDANLKQGG